MKTTIIEIRMFITKGDWIKELKDISREMVWNAVQKDKKKRFKKNVKCGLD